MSETKLEALLRASIIIADLKKVNVELQRENAALKRRVAFLESKSSTEFDLSADGVSGTFQAG